MVEWFWLLVEASVAVWFTVWYGEMRYKQGIWDGAFNHFLPAVRKEMYQYDSHRAAQILNSEKPDA